MKNKFLIIILFLLALLIVAPLLGEIRCLAAAFLIFYVYGMWKINVFMWHQIQKMGRYFYHEK
jgi:hypothetical protein